MVPLTIDRHKCMLSTSYNDRTSESSGDDDDGDDDDDEEDDDDADDEHLRPR